MQRRFLLAAIAAGLAAPQLAFADDVQKLPLTSAFKYLDKYLALSPAQRSRFFLVFRAERNDRPAPTLKAVILGPGAAQTPLPLDGFGQVTRLPTLAELQSGAQLEVWGGPFRFATEIRPTVAPAARIDAGQMNAALAQATAAIKTIAGAFAAMAPALDTMLFPGSGGGQLILAGGRTAPLPLTHAIPQLGPTPYYCTQLAAGTQAVALARAPSRLIIAARPKS